MSDEKKSIYFALLSVLLWSTVATAFKVALKFVDFVHLLFYASFVSMIVLFSASLFLKFKPTPKDLVASLPLGFLNPFLYYLILFKAYSILPAQTAMTLNYTWPLMIVLFSFLFLKQRPTPFEIIGLIVGFSGAVIIAMFGRPSTGSLYVTPGGIALALSSSVVWGIYWILNMKRKIPEIGGLSLNFFWGFIFITLFLSIRRDFYLPGSKGFFATTYVGLFEMGITFVLWLKALNLSKRTAIISNLIYITPFLSLVIISVVLKEQISLWTVLGILLIVSGILIQRFSKH